LQSGKCEAENQRNER